MHSLTIVAAQPQHLPEWDRQHLATATASYDRNIAKGMDPECLHMIGLRGIIANLEQAVRAHEAT